MTEEMKYYTGNCITDLHTDTSISYCNEEKCKQYINLDGLKFCMSSVCPEKDCIYALVYKLNQTIDRLEQENKELQERLAEVQNTYKETREAAKKLKQENEKLKAELQNKSDVFIHEMGLKDEYQDDYTFEKLQKKKFRKALEEIQQTAIDAYSKGTFNSRSEGLKEIEKLINEVLG